MFVQSQWRTWVNFLQVIAEPSASAATAVHVRLWSTSLACKSHQGLRCREQPFWIAKDTEARKREPPSSFATLWSCSRDKVLIKVSYLAHDTGESSLTRCICQGESGGADTEVFVKRQQLTRKRHRMKCEKCVVQHMVKAEGQISQTVECQWKKRGVVLFFHDLVRAVSTFSL